MARTPRAIVSKTSGQGVSRFSYQQGYQLGNRGAGSAFRSAEAKPVTIRTAKADQPDKVPSGKLRIGLDGEPPKASASLKPITPREYGKAPKVDAWTKDAKGDGLKGLK